jgi:hypothetical protein
MRCIKEHVGKTVETKWGKDQPRCLRKLNDDGTAVIRGLDTHLISSKLMW